MALFKGSAVIEIPKVQQQISKITKKSGQFLQCGLYNPCDQYEHFYNIYIDCSSPQLIGDNYCDDVTNTPECNFDGGDCCKVGGVNKTKPDSSLFQLVEIGNIP